MRLRWVTVFWMGNQVNKKNKWIPVIRGWEKTQVDRRLDCKCDLAPILSPNCSCKAREGMAALAGVGEGSMPFLIMAAISPASTGCVSGSSCCKPWGTSNYFTEGWWFENPSLAREIVSPCWNQLYFLTFIWYECLQMNDLQNRSPCVVVKSWLSTWQDPESPVWQTFRHIREVFSRFGWYHGLGYYVKEKSNCTPASISLCFPTVNATWPAASYFCYCNFLLWWTVPSECDPQINPFFLKLSLSRYFITGKRKVTNTSKEQSSLVGPAWVIPMRWDAVLQGGQCMVKGLKTPQSASLTPVSGMFWKRTVPRSSGIWTLGLQVGTGWEIMEPLEVQPS